MQKRLSCCVGRAFTLIELLVVIAILSLLLLAMTDARRRASNRVSQLNHNHIVAVQSAYGASARPNAHFATLVRSGTSDVSWANRVSTGAWGRRGPGHRRARLGRKLVADPRTSTSVVGEQRASMTIKLGILILLLALLLWYFGAKQGAELLTAVAGLGVAALGLIKASSVIKKESQLQPEVPGGAPPAAGTGSDAGTRPGADGTPVVDESATAGGIERLVPCANWHLLGVMLAATVCALLLLTPGSRSDPGSPGRNIQVRYCDKGDRVAASKSLVIGYDIELHNGFDNKKAVDSSNGTAFSVSAKWGIGHELYISIAGKPLSKPVHIQIDSGTYVVVVPFENAKQLDTFLNAPPP